MNEMATRLLTVVSFVVLSTFPSLHALVELPERARGGEAARLFPSISSSSSSAPSSLDSSSTGPFTWKAQVDNFNTHDNRTYAQRYYVDAQYWTPGVGPVFYYIGGEGTLNGPPGGYVATLGKNYSALLISLEHRFYGESIPNNDLSTANYKYLTVEQALADLNAFTSFYKGFNPKTKNVKWFAFGGSYPGALASWYRTAYPDATVGSLSSSGVVNCIVDYYQFDEQVNAAAGNSCSIDIRRVQHAFQRTIRADQEEGLKKSLSLFNCEKDMKETDFYYMIADSWSMAIQYSAKTKLCGALASVGADATDEEVMKNFAAFSNSFWGSDFCANPFYNTVACADPARWETNARSWRWQTCYQVSYFNTAPVRGSLRSTEVNLQYHLDQCAAIFGIDMFPSSKRMNDVYGGESPKADRVFYSDFSDDPWQQASVKYGASPSQPYHLTTCDDCGHCLDLHEESSSDPEALKQGRDEFQKYLYAWLQ